MGSIQPIFVSEATSYIVEACVRPVSSTLPFAGALVIAVVAASDFYAVVYQLMPPAVLRDLRECSYLAKINKTLSALIVKTGKTKVSCNQRMLGLKPSERPCPGFTPIELNGVYCH